MITMNYNDGEYAGNAYVDDRTTDEEDEQQEEDEGSKCSEDTR